MAKPNPRNREHRRNRDRARGALLQPLAAGTVSPVARPSGGRPAGARGCGRPSDRRGCSC
jgi:hypothetical protein